MSSIRHYRDGGIVSHGISKSGATDDAGPCCGEEVDRDIADIIAMMAEYREQLPPELFPDADHETTLASLKAWQKAGDLLYVMPRTADGAVIACIAGVVCDAWFARNLKTVMELIFYVRPEHQGDGIGGKILAEYEQLAQLAGCQVVELQNMSPAHRDIVDRMYLKAGYRVDSIQYSKRL